MVPRKASIVIILAVLVSVGLSGCTTTGPFIAKKEVNEAQRALALKAYGNLINQYIRVNHVGYQLLSNTPLPEDQKPVPYSGLLLGELDKFNKEYYGVTAHRGVVVVGAVSGSPAHLADFRKGDILKRISGKKVSSVNEVHYTLRKFGFQEMVQVEILRGETETMVIEFAQGSMPYFLFFSVLERGDINTVTSPEAIFLTSGMVHFVESDDELAVILGHELVHITHKHLEEMEKDAVSNIIATAFGVQRNFPIPLELEADYYGLQYAHLSGYDVKKGVEFWERVAIQMPQTLEEDPFSRYFSTPERLVQLRKLSEDIDMAMELEASTIRHKSLIAKSGLTYAVIKEALLKRIAGISNVFSTDSEAVIWWGKIETAFTGKEFLAKWYDPDGNLYLEQPFRSTFNNVVDVYASMPIRDNYPSLHPGRWFVEVYHKGNLIEKRSFVIKDFSLPDPAKANITEANQEVNGGVVGTDVVETQTESSLNDGQNERTYEKFGGIETVRRHSV